MKHLLNDLSEEEKNRIREQHTGGKKLVIENFKKLVDTRLGDAKPYLNEQQEPKENSKCKDGDYYLGVTKQTADYVKKYIKDNQSFNGMACIGGFLKQANCKTDKDGKIKCEEGKGN
jgi:hypothetical protein